MIAAITQETRDPPPPATEAAVSAPSSQPYPMIEPRDTKLSPQNPTVRMSPVSVFTVSTGAASAIFGSALFGPFV